MSLANKFVGLKNKELKAKKMMRTAEKSGDWHRTKRAATLLDGRVAQIEKLKKGIN